MLMSKTLLQEKLRAAVEIGRLHGFPEFPGKRKPGWLLLLVFGQFSVLVDVGLG